MSFDRLRSQNVFESIFGGNTSQQWLHTKDSEKYQLMQKDVLLLSTALQQDVTDLYYKGSLSMCEAIRSISMHMYSWATVKLYYSIFYYLKCNLACNNVAIIRKGRDLFYLKVKLGESVSKTKERTDHKGTIYTFMDIYGAADILQSNNINGDNPYIWMMNKRDEVNYKDREFHDPDAPYFWYEVYNMILKSGLDDTLSTFINDSRYKYTFQDDYACLALPLKRMILTKGALQNEGIISLLNENKTKHLLDILPINKTNNILLESFMM